MIIKTGEVIVKKDKVTVYGFTFDRPRDWELCHVDSLIWAKKVIEEALNGIINEKWDH